MEMDALAIKLHVLPIQALQINATNSMDMMMELSLELDVGTPVEHQGLVLKNNAARLLQQLKIQIVQHF
jgi:hypothetical protein